jgi:multidrug resistance protein MdtO
LIPISAHQPSLDSQGEGARRPVRDPVTFLQTLAAELAPTPGRARATLRTVVACLVTTTIIMALHLEHGPFAFVSIFIVSQPNAGASLRKGVLRLLGTTAGAAVGILGNIVFADLPWLRIALLGPTAAFFIFLSNTTTAPYFGLLGGITAILVMTAQAPGADGGIYIGLWRFAMVTLGAAIGTAAQLFLWPEDPEDQLLGELGERLAVVEGLVGHVRDGRRPDAARLDALVLTGLSRQVDLLTDAEARFPSLRLRHAEQIALIGGVEQLLTAAVGLARAASAHDTMPSGPVRGRLDAIGTSCARLRRALETRRPAEPTRESGTPGLDTIVATSGDALLLPALVELERLLDSLPGATGFLDRDRSPVPLPASRALLDAPTSPFFTPAFAISNTEAIGFALRSGLAATIAYVAYHAMAWPGLSTAPLTTMLVAQSSFGATARKALLRLVGATLGGALGLLVIIVAMPNMDSLASLLVVVAPCAALAAWINTGSSRIAYAGLQTALAFALSALNDLGPTTDLEPARDRVIGVLLGIVIAGLVYGLTGPLLAGTEMRRSLATALRSLAGLSHMGLRGDPTAATVAPARGWRWKVYQDLTTTLRLQDESKLEWSSGRADAEAERARVARLAADALGVFLALLAVVRHRLDVDLAAMPPAVHERLQTLAEEVAAQLRGLANQIEGKPEPIIASILGPLLALADEACREAGPALDPLMRVHLQARLAVYGDLVSRLAQLAHDAEAPIIAEPDASKTPE